MKGENTNGATNARCILKALIEHYSTYGKRFGSYSRIVVNVTSDAVPMSETHRCSCTRRGSSNLTGKLVKGMSLSSANLQFICMMFGTQSKVGICWP